VAEPRIGVLHVVHTLNVGGAEKLVFDLARRTDRARFAVSVACLDEAGALAPALSAQGIPVDVLERRPGVDAGLIARLARLARRRGARILHAHQYTPFFYAVSAAPLAGARCLFTEHGRHHPDLRKPKRVAANALLSRLAYRTVAVSEFTRRALIENDGFPPERVSVLYNGVDTSAHEALPPREEIRADLGLDPGVPTIGTCARLSPEKNLPMMLLAFAALRQRVPTARLLIAGDGPARVEVEARVAALGLGESVSLLGFRSDVPAVVSALDVFALSSLTEGTSVTLLEAMLAARPAVVTRVGGNPEIAVEGETAWLVESGDADRFSDRLEDLLRHPVRASSFGAAARARVLSRFTFQGMVHAYEILYASC